jgi:hypothetical protein
MTTKSVPTSVGIIPTFGSFTFNNPIQLRPHNDDGSVGGFYYMPIWMGDLNGDGTGDVMFPTPLINFDNSGAPVISGGGFKLVY